MKSGYYIISKMLALFLLLAAPAVYGQNRIEIKNSQLQTDKGNITFTFDIALNGSGISSNDQWLLTPVVRDKTGKRLELSPVVINGKKRAKLYKRSLRLNGMDADPAVFHVLNAEKNELFNTIPYRTTISYESWMRGASLYLIEDLCGCGGSGKEYLTVAVINPLKFPDLSEFNYTYSPFVRFIDPPKEEIKSRNKGGEAFLFFKSGKWNILPEMGNNQAELEKIQESLDYVKDESAAKITSISIKAYTSPEGTFESNLKLSHNRAEALRQYILKNNNIPANVLSAEGMGESWDGLIQLVEADTKLKSKDKEQILHIIRNVDIFEGREKQLMDLSGGAPFLYMLENLFPALRRSDYKIEYTVPSFSIEKGKELLKTKPEMLSMKEMYLIANTYQKGSESFNNVFIIAARHFPQDKIANLNAAATAILENNYKYAAIILEKYKNEPLAWNNLALVYMKEFRFDEAGEYLQKAEEQGDTEAKQNREILNDFKRAVEEYQRKKAEYDYYK